MGILGIGDDDRGGRSRRGDALGLAALLAAAGTAHFVTPRSYDALIPQALPGSARAWTLGSGVAELAIAAGLAMPKTRRMAGFAAAALFVGVFPGNVKMAIDYRDRAPLARTVAYARLPLQVPLVLWALRVARRTSAGSGAGSGADTDPRADAASGG